ncbi:MAG: class I SAM-dependent methyltransferase [Planctomycetota bacterium]|nr:class I SAM-dependent methyltransferase [Planctomycetota bacterium]
MSAKTWMKNILASLRPLPQDIDAFDAMKRAKFGKVRADRYERYWHKRDLPERAILMSLLLNKALALSRRHGESNILICDFGCYVGTTISELSEHLPEAHYHAIEPEEAALDFLKDRLAHLPHLQVWAWEDEQWIRSYDPGLPPEQAIVVFQGVFQAMKPSRVGKVIEFGASRFGAIVISDLLDNFDADQASIVRTADGGTGVSHPLRRLLEAAGYRIARRIDHRIPGTFLNGAVLAERPSKI